MALVQLPGEMLHRFDEFFVAPVDEAPEIRRVHVHLDLQLATRLPAVEIAAVGAVAAAGAALVVVRVRPPVHVVEVDPVEVEMVEDLAQVLGQPVAEGRVPAEPALVPDLFAAVVEHLDHPLGTEIGQLVVEDERVISQNDHALFVGHVQKARNRLQVQVVGRGENLRGVEGDSPGPESGYGPDLGAGRVDGLDLLFHGRTGNGLVHRAQYPVRGEAPGIVLYAADSFVVGHRLQTLGG